MIDFKQSQPEQSIYILPQDKKRALVPKIVSLTVLGIIFYLAVLLNISLLELTAAEETTIKIVSLIFLLGIIVLGIYLSFHRSNQSYKFYQDKITFMKNQITYLEISNTKSKVDFLDKIFKTVTINCGNNFFIRNVPAQLQIDNYLEKLVAYHRGTRPTSS